MTQRDHDTYANILTAASSSLCTGTPTAKFEDVFATLESKATPVATGSTVFSDRFTSSTAVSLYYTASGVQGPGAITGRFSFECSSIRGWLTKFLGSATGATASIATIATTANMDPSTSGGKSGSAGATVGSAGTTAAGGASKSQGATPTSKNGALPTKSAALGGIMAAAGGAVFALW